MKKKIIIRTLLISLCAMAVFGACSVLLVWYYAESMVKDDLIRLSDVVRAGAERPGADFSELVRYENTAGKAFRLTFIDSAGVVLADSAEDPAAMGSHAGRDEFKAAMSGRREFYKRDSETLNKRMMYYAVAFTGADGGARVLRVALETSPIAGAAGRAVAVLVGVTAALAAALAFAGGKYANPALLPLNEIKSRLHTLNAGAYKKISIGKDNEELLPVLNEINEIAENINALNRVRSEFFANASHELNTPLTYIAGYAELMEQGLLTDGAKIRECGAKIGAESARMNNLVKDMLKLAYIENASEEAKYEDVDMRAALNAAAETLAPLAAEKGVRVKTLCFAETIRSDPKLIDHILINLIQNAIKYNREGGSVEVVAKRVKDRVEITVSDTGVGVAPENQSRIFERFYRADKGRTGGGTGLGLAIVKHSAAKLSGSVRVESELGEGSKFIVELPG
jgi:two-component system phosphate regulon sensor histidine kinase PhoR